MSASQFSSSWGSQQLASSSQHASQHASQHETHRRASGKAGSQSYRRARARPRAEELPRRRPAFVSSKRRRFGPGSASGAASAGISTFAARRYSGLPLVNAGSKRRARCAGASGASHSSFDSSQSSAGAPWGSDARGGDGGGGNGFYAIHATLRRLELKVDGSLTVQRQEMQHEIASLRSIIERFVQAKSDAAASGSAPSIGAPPPLAAPRATPRAAPSAAVSRSAAPADSALSAESATPTSAAKSAPATATAMATVKEAPLLRAAARAPSLGVDSADKCSIKAQLLAQFCAGPSSPRWNEASLNDSD